MEWYELKNEIKEFEEMPREDVQNIIRDGIKSEFWRFFRSKMARTLWEMDIYLKRAKVNSMDDLVSLSKFQVVFKNTEELMNFPENFLLAMTEQAKTAIKSKKQ